MGPFGGPAPTMAKSTKTTGRDPGELAALLTNARAIAGISQAEHARRYALATGCSLGSAEVTLSRWARAEREPDVGALRAALECIGWELVVTARPKAD